MENIWSFWSFDKLIHRILVVVTLINPLLVVD